MSVTGNAAAIPPAGSPSFSRNTGAAPYAVYNTAASPRKPYNMAGQPPYQSQQPLFNRVRSYVDQKFNTFNDSKFSSDENMPQYRKNDRFGNVKKMLVAKCLERRLFPTPVALTKMLGLPKGAFTVTAIVQTCQMAIQIATICLTSQAMENSGKDVSSSVWSFLIAQASIILAISTLFVFRVLSLQKNGAVFYTITASCMSFTAFGVVLGCLMTSRCTVSSLYCRIRKGVTGIVCLSAFLWLMELVAFLTIIYVSRLNIIPDPDESADDDMYNVAPKELDTNSSFVDPHQFLKTPSIYQPVAPASAVSPSGAAPDIVVNQPEPEKIKQYIVTEDGLNEVTDPSQLVGKKRLELYASPDSEAATPQN